MYQDKTVLIAPLDWGLGHATRIVPIVEKLFELNARVIIAADNRPYNFLRLRFPDIKIIRLKGYEPKYPNNSLMAANLMFSIPKMWYHSRKARKYLRRIINEYGIKLIISDNRFECYHETTYSVFISHQLQIQTKGLQNIFNPIIRQINHYYIKKYDELWIPDFEDPKENLSGILSYTGNYPAGNYRFIGPLSRFSTIPQETEKSDEPDLLAILSGPEPQRSILEQLLEKQIHLLGLKATMVLGKPEEKSDFRRNSIRYISHAGDALLSELIQSANIIISRPGYSTIMDLCVFGKNAIFIPTPGQTEQEYLAEMMQTKAYCYAEKQQTFNLERALHESTKYRGLPKMEPTDKITPALETILKKV